MLSTLRNIKKKISNILPEPFKQFLLNISYIHIPINVFFNKQYSSPLELILLNIKIEFYYFIERQTNRLSYNRRGKTYQSYQVIASGMKSSRKGTNCQLETVENRIANYEIIDILRPSMRMMDIGSNSCFISIYLAQFVKFITAVEPNKYLIRVGKLVADHLKVKNIEFYDITFDKYFDNYCEPGNFDFIMSLAAFYTGDGGERSSAAGYIKKANNLLKRGGYFLFESIKINRRGNDYREVATLSIIREMESAWKIIRKNRIDYANDRCRYLLLAQNVR